ncbi:MAG TPA: serine hydrolase [Steroidobacteraceae bacterium]|jgi:CubicO group peptidase (beta-lactamase class C family)
MPLVKLRRRRFLVISSVLVGTALAGAAPPPTPAGIKWSAGASADVDLAALQALYADMERDSHADLKGIVVVRDGRLVSEHYFNGDDAGTLHDIRSATKSITSLLMGIAIDKGVVRGVEEPISKYLPDLPKDGKEKITVRDLLNMRSGLDADDVEPASPGNEDTLNRSSDWIRTVYAVPMKRAPGEKYVYASINAFLAGAIIENASHMRLDEFAEKNLFAPLAIRKFKWESVPVNRITGQGNFSITTRDAAALGQMVLDGGAVDGHRIVARKWIDASLSRQVGISDSDPYADFYGFMWYTKDEPLETGTVEVHFASGNGGNKIYVVPSLHLVVAITSSAYGHGYGQRRSQQILFKILAAAR